MKTQVEKFINYHTLNPNVYDVFKGFVADVKAVGKTKYSSRTILHRIRWHVNIETRRIDDFKIGDHHSPYYARMYMYEYNDDDFFSIKNIEDLKDFENWLEVYFKKEGNFNMTKLDGKIAHSKLGASNTSRWMNCPGSVEATKDYPDTKNIYAAEGTAAHSIGDACLKSHKDAEAYLGNVIAVDEWEFEVNREMVTGVQMYLDVVRDDMKELGAKQIYAEQRVDLNRVHKGMFGTSDAILIKGKYLKVYDLKYGRGVVDVRENTQALFYAVGALLLMDQKKEVQEIEMVIVQPRVADPIKRWTVTRQYLKDWIVVLREAAAATLADDAPRIPGEKQCQFCEHKPACPELEQFALEKAMIEFDDEGDVSITETDELSEEQMTGILKWSNFIQNYLKAVESKALQMLKRGEKVKGFKLVEKRAIRQWNKDASVEEGLLDMGLLIDEILSEPSLLSPAQIDKLLSKEQRQDMNANLITKKSSGTKMVPESDPAPEVSAGVESDFADD